MLVYQRVTAGLPSSPCSAGLRMPVEESWSRQVLQQVLQVESVAPKKCQKTMGKCWDFSKLMWDWNVGRPKIEQPEWLRWLFSIKKCVVALHDENRATSIKRWSSTGKSLRFHQSLGLYPNLWRSQSHDHSHYWLVVTGTMEWIMTFHSGMENHSNWRAHSIIFQRARLKPPTRSSTN